MAENAVKTRKQRAKRCRTLANQEGGMTAVQKMIFGTGGVDAQGAVLAPNETQENLNSRIEGLDKDIESTEFMNEEQTTCRYKATLSEQDAVDQMISEIALVDTDGDLVAIKNFLPKGKDADSRITFYIDVIE